MSQRQHHSTLVACSAALLGAVLWAYATPGLSQAQSAEISDRSVLTVVPYAPVPRVLFYELTLIPSSTTVTPGQSIQFDLEEIKTWGMLITNGQNFQGSFGFGRNQQYKGSAVF